MLLLAGLAAAEWTPGAAPRWVGEVELGGRAVTWVDWGPGGPSRARDPAQVAEELAALRRWLRTPEFLARATQLAALGEQRGQELMQREMLRWQTAYRTEEQPTRYARRIGRLLDEVELPLWAWGMPATMREAGQIALFDDRDPAQRAWVRRIADEQRDRRYTLAIATGWRSGEDRDAYWREAPGAVLNFAPVASDELATYYQVEHYPALIRFTEQSMLIEQGMDP